MQTHQSVQKSKKSDITSVAAQFQTRPFAAQPKVEDKRTDQEKLAQMREQRLASERMRPPLPMPTFPDAPPPVQPKLTIGEPGDKYEQEADRVARQVVDQIHAPQPLIQPKAERQPMKLVGDMQPSLLHLRIWNRRFNGQGGADNR